MTETERKALALVNEVLAEWGVLKNAVEVPKNSDAFARALLRAIEQHEAFRQEVSDALKSYYGINSCMPHRLLAPFIIAKPDPLVEAWIEATGNTVGMEPLNEALAKRGGKIVWGGG